MDRPRLSASGKNIVPGKVIPVYVFNQKAPFMTRWYIVAAYPFPVRVYVGVLVTLKVSLNFRLNINPNLFLQILGPRINLLFILKCKVLPAFASFELLNKISLRGHWKFVFLLMYQYHDISWRSPEMFQNLNRSIGVINSDKLLTLTIFKFRNSMFDLTENVGSN